MITLELLARLRQSVFEKRPILGKVYANYKDHSIRDYVQSWQVQSIDRHLVFAQYLEQRLERVYGKDTARAVTASFVRQPLVSTIDHHGFLNHPFFINSNLIYSFRKPEYMVCLPTASVSLNNSTSWSACLLTHTDIHSISRFSFLPDRAKTQTVFATEAITPKDVYRVLERVNESPLEDRYKIRLRDMLESVFLQDTFSQLPDFSSQAVYASTAMWDRVFPTAPRVMYAPLEDLVVDVMLGEIAQDHDHVLHRLLFTSTGWDCIGRHFEGRSTAFSGTHKGSFLFWGISEKKRRVRMIKQGNELVGGHAVIHPNVEALSLSLRNRLMYPTSLVCFLVLLHYGITCLGGLNQVNRLTHIKEIYLAILKEWGEVEEYNVVSKMVTDNFAESNVAFGLMGGEVYKPTGIDIYMKGQDFYSLYEQLSAQLTLGDSLDSVLPEAYQIITSSQERNTSYEQVSEFDILRQNGIEELVTRLFK